jgi:hypothetical protein
MTSRPALCPAFVRRGVFVAALVFLFAAPPAKPALAQGYEGLVEAQSGYNTQRRGGASPGSEGSGYEGLVGWTPQQSATNPYGTAPASDIYQFVRGSGATMDERRDMGRAEREQQKHERRQQIMDGNRQRDEALQEKLKADNEARQRRNLEQHAEIMQRIQQQQQQQQQQQRR